MISHTLVSDCRDSGAGVSPDQAGRLFEAFFSTDPGKIGLGLAIARSIVAAHGGTIGLVEDGGPGAIFAVSLPLAGED